MEEQAMVEVAPIFSEDVVTKVDDPTVLGFVSRVAGESDSEDDEDDEEEEGALAEGFVQVCWLNSDETTEDLKGLEILDRAFIPGDIVAWASDRLGQTGTVVRVDIKAELEHPNGDKFTGVDTQDLRHVRAFREGTYVAKGLWVGRVDHVLDDLTLVFDDGAMCLCEKVNPDFLFPVHATATDADYEYYPGQRVYAASSRFFRSARWLKGAWKSSHQEATVVHVQTSSVAVSWMCTCHSPTAAEESTANERLPDAPPSELEPEGLVAVSCYTGSTWQIGDRCLPPLTWDKEKVTPGNPGEKGRQAEVDDIPEGRAWEGDLGQIGGPAGDSMTAREEGTKEDGEEVNGNSQSNHAEGLGPRGGEVSTSQAGAKGGESGSSGQRRRRKRGSKKERKKSNPRVEIAEFALQVIRTESKVDVVWQDGTRTSDVSARSLVPVDHLGEHDFWPGEFVVEKAPEESVDGQSPLQTLRTGVVKSVDAKQRTAVVQWLLPVSTDMHGSLCQVASEEVVSVYELAGHPDYAYRLGDVVIRLPSGQEKLDQSEAAAAYPPAGHDATSGAGGGQVDDSSLTEAVEKLTAELEAQRLARNGPGLPETVISDGQSKDAVLVQGSGSEASGEREPDQTPSWVGNIVQLEGGEILVAWADGTQSKMGPQSLYVVSREEEEEEEEGMDSEDLEDDGASWETVSEDGNEEDTLAADAPAREAAGHRTGEEEPGEDSALPDAAMPPGTAKPATQAPAGVGPSPAGGEAPPATPRGALGFAYLLGATLFSFRRGEGRAEGAGAGAGAVGREEGAGLMGGEGGPAASAGHEESRLEGAEAAAGRQASSEDQRGAAVRDSQVAAQDATEAGGGRGEERRLGEGRVDGAERGLAGPEPVEHEKRKGSEGSDFTGVGTHGSDSPDLRTAGSTGAAASGRERLAGVGSAEESGMAAGDVRRVDVDLNFKRFDSVKDCSDHHFVGQTEQPTSRKWSKAVQREWSILQANLPDTVWVRVFEERMDLLRAAILGAPGTPYHDNLFLFDMWLPPDYPNVPPVVHYHSWGFRVNPNLYETGKVCLSLLNTWNGQGTEVWHAGASSLLQVLVSIQGLVLVPKPYFNEAGYDRQVGTAEGEKNSVVYNESAFLLSVKSMLQLVRRPPKHFEDLIRAHFRARGDHILASCQAYIQGARVGSFEAGKCFSGQGIPGEASASGDDLLKGKPAFENAQESEGQVGGSEGQSKGETQEEGEGVSTGFKLLLAKLILRLEQELAQIQKDST